MGNRYLSVVLGDLRSRIEVCRNLQETLTEFRDDCDQVDEMLPNDIQKLVTDAIDSTKDTISKTRLVAEEIEEALNRG